MEQYRCAICNKALTEEEIGMLTATQFVVACREHHVFRNIFQVNIAQAIAGTNNNNFTAEQIKQFKENFPANTELNDQVLRWLRDQIIKTNNITELTFLDACIATRKQEIKKELGVYGI